MSSSIIKIQTINSSRNVLKMSKNEALVFNFRIIFAFEQVCWQISKLDNCT